VERIAQALERARSERQRAAGEPLPAFSAAEADQLLEGSSDHSHRRSSESENDIRYTRTASIPVDKKRLEEKRILLAHEDNYALDAYKVLRTQVRQRMRIHGWRTLGVTSPSEGNGKTVTAINLAISLARDVTQTVLLVDLDLRRPSLNDYFPGGQGVGLSDFLTGEAEIPDILINPGIDRLVVLPGNHPIPHSSEMLSSPKMVRLLDELKTRYSDRVLILDMPPVLVVDDVIAFLPYMDAVMLVVEDGKTTREELRSAQELLGEKMFGTVLNKSTSDGAISAYY
jgi:capsular exopolysaccharide synthesis family protein